MAYCTPAQGFSCIAPDLGHLKMRAYRANFDNYRDDNSMHGSAAVGTAIGLPTNTDITTLRNRGIAPRARVAFVDIADDAGDLGVPVPMDVKLFPWFKTHNAYIQSHSWGSFSSLGYNSQAQAVDRYMWDNQDVLIVFAAGNSGDRSSFGNTLLLTAEANAKNALSVGATMNELEGMLRFPSFANAYSLNGASNRTLWGPTYVAQFSSNGPTLDWRIKPDISAPGVLILTSLAGAPRTNTPVANCIATQVLAGWTGTSFSAPLMAGTAILVREWLQTGGYAGIPFSSPSAALLKSLLIAVARPIGGINYYDLHTVLEAAQMNANPHLYPFGALFAGGHGVPVIGDVLENAFLLDTFSPLAMQQQATQITSFTANGQEQAVCLTGTGVFYSGALAYADFPASTATFQNARQPKLINDVNMAIVYRDNAGCHIAYANNLHNVDDRNNAERIRVAIPTTALLLVHAFDINVAPQEWAIAIRANTSFAAQTLVLHLDNSSSTSLPTFHACSQLYSSCRVAMERVRHPVFASPPSTTTPPPTHNSALRLVPGLIFLLLGVHFY